ncbi:MAG: AraC family ligand binding domain-containing protein [Candidatus Pacebacteria bacterium]|nr:AraC family ligand binding domain-containing protein [Candidatus Paceibacterota bacterium]
MIIRKKEAQIEKISSEGNVWDYPMPNEQIGIAFQGLNGRVPDYGWYKNKACYEICYLISGSGIFFIDGSNFKASAGDVVVIERNKKSYIEAKNLKMITITKPNWSEEQCQLIKK